MGRGVEPAGRRDRASRLVASRRPVRYPVGRDLQQPERPAPRFGLRGWRRRGEDRRRACRERASARAAGHRSAIRPRCVSSRRKCPASGSARGSLSNKPRRASPRRGSQATETLLESPFYRLVPDAKTGGIASLVHVASGKELIAAGQNRTLCQTVYFDGQERLLDNVRRRAAGRRTGLRAASHFGHGAGHDRREPRDRLRPTRPGRFRSARREAASGKEERLCHVFPLLGKDATLRAASSGAVVRPRPQPAGDLLPGADTRRFAVQEFVNVARDDLVGNARPARCFRLAARPRPDYDRGPGQRPEPPRGAPRSGRPDAVPLPLQPAGQRGWLPRCRGGRFCSLGGHATEVENRPARGAGHRRSQDRSRRRSGGRHVSQTGGRPAGRRHGAEGLGDRRARRTLADRGELDLARPLRPTSWNATRRRLRSATVRSKWNSGRTATPRCGWCREAGGNRQRTVSAALAERNETLQPCGARHGSHAFHPDRRISGGRQDDHDRAAGQDVSRSGLEGRHRHERSSDRSGGHPRLAGGGV